MGTSDDYANKLTPMGDNADFSQPNVPMAGPGMSIPLDDDVAQILLKQFGGADSVVFTWGDTVPNMSQGYPLTVGVDYWFDVVKGTTLRLLADGNDTDVALLQVKGRP